LLIEAPLHQVVNRALSPTRQLGRFHLLPSAGSPLQEKSLLIANHIQVLEKRLQPPAKVRYKMPRTEKYLFDR
jgi:hypothetical protein